MTLSKKYCLGAVVSVGLMAFNAPAGLTQPNHYATSTATQAFSTPTYEKQLLPQKLNTSEAWHAVANNAFVAQDYANSLAAYGKAIDLASPGDRPQLLEERGWVHYMLGHFERATEDLQSAASLYWQQEQLGNYRNARQMRQFIEAQAQRLDSIS